MFCDDWFQDQGRSLCPSTAMTQMTRTLPVLPPLYRVRPVTPPSHPAVAVSKKAHVHCTLLSSPSLTHLRFYLLLRWWGIRLQGHGYRDHQQWGGAGVPTSKLLRNTRDVRGWRRKSRSGWEPHGRPRHAPLLTGLFHQGQSGRPAQHRPRGLPELSVARHGRWVVCDLLTNRTKTNSSIWLCRVKLQGFKLPK